MDKRDNRVKSDKQWKQKKQRQQKPDNQHVLQSKDELVTTEREKRADEAIRGLTKMWTDEEPDVNVDRPYPSKTDRKHFCWYDLSDAWSENRSPQPFPIDIVDRGFKYGDKDFAHLPFSEALRECEETSNRPSSELIEAAMISFSKGVRSLDHLEEGIKSYWEPFEAKTLRRLFNEESAEVCKSHLETITSIARLALRWRHLITKPLPLLNVNGRVESVSMSQEQAAVLLAYAFFCTILPRKNSNHFSIQCFHTRVSPVMVEKMKFMLHYFKTVTQEMPRGTLTFSRQAFASKKAFDTWNDSLSQLHVTSKKLIEDVEGCLDVDFANRYIGGGVMRHGAVQEEILFLCCPEMMVSIFLCEKMESHEAILIQGAQHYSGYTGYMSKVKHVPIALKRNEKRDRFGRVRSNVIAIDATKFFQKEKQYEMQFITREMTKAYAGFMLLDEDTPARPIVTGNWGCGVYNGDKELKSLLQFIAASKAGRPMIYTTFKDEVFAEQLEKMYEVIKAHNLTNGKLFQLLSHYNGSRRRGEGVFDFIRTALSHGY